MFSHEMKVVKLDYHGFKDGIVVPQVLLISTLLARVWRYSFMNCFLICCFGCYRWEVTFHCFNY